MTPEQQLNEQDIPALTAALREAWAENKKLAVLARAVMNGFEKHGADIWPHYCDDDDNDAQFLRTRVQNLLGDWQPTERDIALARPDND